MQKYVETEAKFDIDREWALPDLAALVPDDGRIVEATASLDSTYFDTADAALRSFGVTLRRRVGGADTGWQLKVPHGTSRIELRSGSRAKAVPVALADAADGLMTGQALAPVARLLTTRTSYQIRDAEDHVLLEFADDAVEHLAVGDDVPAAGWRQLEIEVGPAGRKKIFKQARKLVRKAGAEPSASRNKLDQALGPLPTSGTRPGSLGELVGAYVAEQCDVLASNDVGLRTGEHLVHKTRVAARRLRSVLRVFEDLFAPSAAAALNRDLAWWADLLGPVRDRDVLDQRLSGRVASLPAGQRRDDVGRAIATILDHERDDALRKLHAGMDRPRYRRLIRQLREWRTVPPLTDEADADDAAVTEYVSRAKHKAYKRLRKAGDDSGRLHRARKAMKRLRYSAELGRSTDKRLPGIAKDAKHLQTVLGDHQDAVVAAGFLARAYPAANAAAAFTFGALMAEERAEAARIRTALQS